MTYTPDHVRAAVDRTFDFFKTNPSKRVTYDLARTKLGQVCSPFSPNADCFCFIGRLAHELGPLPESDAPGFGEVTIAVGGYERMCRLYETNDQEPNDTEFVLEAERELLIEYGVIDE